MIPLTIFLGVVCAVLFVLLSAQDNKNTRMAVENSLMKSRMEALEEKASVKDTADKSEPLTADGVEEAIRHEGYVPDRGEDCIRFMVAGEPFFAEIDRLPIVFVLRQYGVDTSEWEMDLLKQAAHLMSDELIMAKASFHNDDTVLRFFVAALDANKASFQENLTKYIGIITEARQTMDEIYERLVKEKREAALAVNPFLTESKPENKVMS